MSETSFLALIKSRNEQAREKIGSHLLVGIACGNGIVFARRSSARRAMKTRDQKGPSDWATLFDNRIMLTSIGEVGDVDNLLRFVVDTCEDLDSFVGSRYLTHKYVKDAARHYLEERYDNILKVDPYAVTALSAALDDLQRFYVLDFTGRVREFFFFAVAGCATTDEETKQRQANTIQFLTERCGDGQAAKWTVNGRGTQTALTVFRKFNPPKSGEMIQLAWITPQGVRHGFRRIGDTKKRKR